MQWIFLVKKRAFDVKAALKSWNFNSTFKRSFSFFFEHGAPEKRNLLINEYNLVGLRDFRNFLNYGSSHVP